jgi:hypothetical protein
VVIPTVTPPVQGARPSPDEPDEDDERARSGRYPDLVTPELQLSFRRGGEELTLELCHDIATAEFVVNCRQGDGANKTDRTDRFADVAQATAYLHFIEGRLMTESWTRTQVRRWTREASPAATSADASPNRPVAQVYRMNAPSAAPAAATTSALAPTPAPTPTPAPKPAPAPTPAPEQKQGFVQPERPLTPPPPPTDAELNKGIYALEQPLVCPLCREWIRSIRVVRLSRTQVPFTSTLPRSGRALACSACDGVLSLELVGIL